MKESTKEILEKKLEEMKANPCKITAESVADIWEPARTASAEASAAMEAYDRDLETRRANLDRQAAELDEQIGALKAEISTLETESRDAASRGNLDAAAEADEKAERLRKQLSTATRKRRIANRAELQGTPELFQKVRKAKQTYDEMAALCGQYVVEAQGVIEAQQKAFEALSRNTRFANRSPYFDTRRYEKIDHHFNADAYAHMAEKEEAARSAQEEADELERARRMRTIVTM